MTTRRRFACVLGGALLLWQVPGEVRAQQRPALQPEALTIAGDVARPLTLSPEDLKTLPRGTVEVKAEDGTVNVYEGVFVGELLKRAGVLSRSELAAQRPARVAAAANLNFALTEIAKQFEQSEGARVELVFGASGTLTRQIQDGAPFEMFLAADEEFPNQLAAAGLTRDAGVVYAVGQLVIFAPRGSPLSVDERLEGLERLVKSGKMGRFAIANPEVAPYGRAAEALLRTRGLWDGIRPNLVLGDSITQAAQFATTGNAVGGLIAYSLVLAPAFGNRGTYAVISQSDHPPLRQRMVLLKTAGPVAARFYAYLRTETAHMILRKHGFAVPQ